MIKEYIRALTDTERFSLQERLDVPCPVSGWETLRWIVIWGSGLLLLSLIAVGLIAWQPHPVIGGILFLAGIICLYACLMVINGFFHWRKVDKGFRKKTIPIIKQVLEEGSCLSRDFRACEVYEIEEFEDEGAGYIFKLENNKCLLLKGQQYLPEKEMMPWPASEFSLVYSVDKNLWIGLFSSGAKLEPTRTIKMEECTDEYIWSEHEDVVDGSPEDILKGIVKSGND